MALSSMGGVLPWEVQELRHACSSSNQPCWCHSTGRSPLTHVLEHTSAQSQGMLCTLLPLQEHLYCRQQLCEEAVSMLADLVVATMLKVIQGAMGLSDGAVLMCSAS